MPKPDRFFGAAEPALLVLSEAGRRFFVALRSCEASALFLEVMHAGSVKARKLNPIMLTSAYKNLTDGDLRAMFAYLRTLKPVQHRVDNSEPPTFCKRCRPKTRRRRPELGRIPHFI